MGEQAYFFCQPNQPPRIIIGLCEIIYYNEALSTLTRTKFRKFQKLSQCRVSVQLRANKESEQAEKSKISCKFFGLLHDD